MMENEVKSKNKEVQWIYTRLETTSKFKQLRSPKNRKSSFTLKSTKGKIPKGENHPSPPNMGKDLELVKLKIQSSMGMIIFMYIKQNIDQKEKSGLSTNFLYTSLLSRFRLAYMLRRTSDYTFYFSIASSSIVEAWRHKWFSELFIPNQKHLGLIQTLSNMLLRNKIPTMIRLYFQ